MKTKSILLASLAALALPGVASATLLVGWHSFADDVAIAGFQDASPNQNASGYSGTVYASGANSGPNSGSDDRWYGPSSSGVAVPPVTPAPGPPPVLDSHEDGRLNEAGGTTVIVANNTGLNYTLSHLLFDAGRTFDGTAVFTLSYSYYDAGNNQIVSNAPLLTSQSVARTPNTGRDYDDFSVAIPGAISLAAGERIEFAWTNATSQIRLDNIALTGFLPIPEPTAAIALAGLLGSGAFFRRRKVTA